MQFATDIVIALVALLHVYFLVLEMFLWTRRAGLKAFGLTLAFAQSTKAMAANQGLYNGFLAAGLGIGLLYGNEALGFGFKLFFLSCVVVAGLFGAVTISRKILYVQAVPALLGLALLVMAHQGRWF